MNERIQELAVRVGAHEVAPHDFLFRQEQLQKFAELIVRECISECWYDATPKQIADNIREKFGVEG